MPRGLGFNDAKRYSRLLNVALFASCVIVVIVAPSLGGQSAAAHEGVHVEIATLAAKIQKNPQNVDLYIERAALFRREKQYAAALTDLATAEKIAPQKRETMLEKALTLEARGDAKDAKEAETLLSTYLASGLPSAKAFETRGKIREKTKRYAAARTDYAAAVTLAPNPELFLARGRMDERLEHWDDAARGYEEGLQKLAGAVVIRLALIRVEHQRGHYDRAITLIDEILPHLPVKGEWLLLRADQHAAAARPADALRDRQNALREADERITRRPTDLVRMTRVKALRALGRNDEALREIETVVEHAPKLDEARELRDEIRASLMRKAKGP